jgi:hypothetical protein
VAAEEIILQRGNISISTARAALGRKRYPISDIKSVTYCRKEANHAPGIIVLLAGIILGACIGSGSSSALMGMLAAGEGISMGIILLFAARPRHIVRIGIASGERDVLISQDEGLVRQVVAAINQAIKSG